jgi:hypothetical protein
VLEEISAVKKGIETEVLQKSKRLLDPTCCLSLITKQRTLDLQFNNSQERNKMFRGMKGLLETHCPQKFYQVKFVE